MTDLSTLLILASSGLTAGLVNAVAGGGSFFTFSALIASGLSPVVANATSAVAVAPATFASAWAYRSELTANARRFAALGVASLTGGMLGAFILTQTSDSSFDRLVPWLLLFATLVFALSPKIIAEAQRIAPRREGDHALGRWILGLSIQFLVAIYGGFFGAGMGIVMLAALAITEGDDFHLNNSGKHLCATAIQLVSVVMFIAADLVSWPETMVVGTTAVVGGYFGVVLGRKLAPAPMRWLVTGIGACLTAFFFVH